MIKSMNHITLAVSAVDKSFHFYREVIGLKPLVKWNKGAYFLVGEAESSFWFCLNFDQNPKSTPSNTHYAFSVDAESFKEMSERIISFGTKIYKNNSSPGESLYFLDPDGHKLEIHVGDWKARMMVKRKNIGSWEGVEWFT